MREERRRGSTTRSWRRCGLRMLAVTLVLVACGAPGGAPTSGAPGVIFQDDFSQTTSGWDSHTGADVITD